MRNTKFIPNGKTTLKKSLEHKTDLAKLDKRLEELKIEKNESTPLRKAEIELEIKHLKKQRKDLCPKGALW